MTMKKKILVDLDVITVSEWEKKDPRREASIKFVNRAKNEDIVTPFLLIERTAKWKHDALRDLIEDFYIKHSKILTDKDIEEGILKRKVDDKTILLDLESEGVKPEDAFLVLVTSIFDLDHLVTMNRRHLKNKEEIINNILRKHKQKEVDIVDPREI